MMGASVRKLYSHVILSDDDNDFSTPTIMQTFASEAKSFPSDMFSNWALRYESYDDYWSRTMPEEHDTVQYAGTALALVPSKYFDNVGELGGAYPREFMVAWDVWLNAYIVNVRKGQLRRSQNPVHSSLATEDYQKNAALSQKPGMRALKTRFIQHLSLTIHWPFDGPGVRNFDKDLAAARAIAESGDLRAAVVRFEAVVKFFPEISRGWNDLGVTYLRYSTEQASADERIELLHKAQEALERGLVASEQRSEKTLRGNLAIVQTHMEDANKSK